MLTSKFTAIVVLLVSALSTASAQEDMPQLRTGEMPGLEVVATRHFAGKGLYGHINGGADLYHEYGFDRLLVQEVRLNEQVYWVEVHRMTDPRAAVGIFTVSRGNCRREDSLALFSCSSARSVQWALGTCFVRISNSSGSPAAREGGMRLARILSKKIQGGSFEIPPLPAGAGGNAGNLVFVRGALGMQNGCEDWSPLVDRLQGFEGYIVTSEDSSGTMRVGDFRFTREADLGKFENDFSQRGAMRRSYRKGDRRLIVMESAAPVDSFWVRLLRLP